MKIKYKIFINDGVYKIGDFGFAKVAANSPEKIHQQELYMSLMRIFNKK